jgi:hypothetical protein
VDFPCGGGFGWVYRLRVEDIRGRAIELSGTDPEALQAEAIRQIESLDDAV